MEIKDQENFVKSMNRLVRTCQLIAVVLFVSIYFLGLTRQLMDKQLLVCTLCVVAEVFMIWAKSNLQKNINILRRQK